MRGCILTDWNQMVYRELEKPVPKPGEVLLKVIYAGVCGSDITVYKGAHPTATVPVVLGHEILATVEQTNCTVPLSFGAGDRVTVDPVVNCGACEACLDGHNQVCRNLKLTGLHLNGGYEEYVCVGAEQIVKVPEGISDKAAALAEPFAVGFHVVSRAQVRIGDRVLVVGAGPIGIVVALVAKLAGARSVVLSELSEKRIDFAKSFGFETIQPGKDELMEQMRRYTDGRGFDVVIDATGSKAAATALPDLCRIRGTIVPMGLSGTPVEIPLGKISFKEQTIVGSRLYTYDHFERAVAMLPELQQRFDVERLVTDLLPIEQAQTAIDQMMAGTNLGKILLTF